MCSLVSLKRYSSFFQFLLLFVFVLPAQAQTDGTSQRVYIPPQSVQDGWRTANAIDHGLSVDSLNVLFRLIEDTPPEDFRALSVARHGELIVDAYFNSYNRNSLHDIRSATKSITGLLVGIALEQGVLPGLDAPMPQLFPVQKITWDANSRKSSITLRNLLTMQSALDADAFDMNSPGNEANWLGENFDWLEYVINIPMRADEPGERYVYNSANAFLAGAAIEVSTGNTLESFARENLFQPLGISEFYWSHGPGGHTAGMGNLYLNNRDFLKFGQLILDDGAWDSHQVLPPDWALVATEKYAELPMPFFDTHGYGFLWYVGTKQIRGRQIDYTFASGNGGNVVYVVPQLDLVVALMSSGYGTGYGNNRSNNIFEFILRSVTDLEAGKRTSD